ncbi:MAG TPA: hypothetical protein VFU32_14065 [Ktedonobacterales bacterium]|nr:hypothetical protein [Ktedonobacterales bacterium]
MMWTNSSTYAVLRPRLIVPCAGALTNLGGGAFAGRRVPVSPVACKLDAW